MMRPPIYDWDTIEQDFIHDNVPLHNGVTLKTIAIKYGIPYQTVRRKAAADKWHSNRFWCYRMKTGEDRSYWEMIDKEIKRLEVHIQRRERLLNNSTKSRRNR